MHVATKIVLVIGALMTAGGAVLVVMGGSDIAEIDTFVLENVTNGTVEIVDDDGEGDLGFTFWMKGNYTDVDDDGYWDHCNSTNISIIMHPEIAGWSEGYGGEFYYEAGDWDVYGASDCKSDDRNKHMEHESEGLIKVGRACLACYEGTFEFESNASVWVTYDDEVIGDFIEGLMEVLGGGACACCGIVILISGIIMIFALTDEDPIVDVTVQGGTGVGLGVVQVGSLGGSATLVQPDLSDDSAESEADSAEEPEAASEPTMLVGKSSE